MPHFNKLISLYMNTPRRIQQATKIHSKVLRLDTLQATPIVDSKAFFTMSRMHILKQGNRVDSNSVRLTRNLDRHEHILPQIGVYHNFLDKFHGVKETKVRLDNLSTTLSQDGGSLKLVQTANILRIIVYSFHKD